MFFFFLIFCKQLVSNFPRIFGGTCLFPFAAWEVHVLHVPQDVTNFDFTKRWL